jgi:tetratricopeptide (TPR) repeat protein
MIQLPIVEGDRLGGCEVFDDADLDAAIARFEELHRPAPRLENGASRVHDRLAAYYAARDWDAATKTLADDFCSDDRRHVVNVGLRHGRDVAIANMQKSADLAITFGKSDVIATRGDRLALSRTRWSGPDQRPEAFHTEVLHVAEINADERVAARVMFDANDIDAAFAELDARYLAGEAADHAHTWSVITQSCAAFNRHELPATTRDSIYIDHRPGVTVEAVDLDDLTRATWDVTPNASIYIEAVHRLSDLGAVVTYTAHGSSRDGFAAEWRMVDMFMVDGDLISRNELFDEADLDAALARFEELQSQAPRLENAASQVIERFGAYFAARNWAAIAEISADEIITDDRRSVVSSGILRGRDLDIANIRATADLGAAHLTTKVIATRGERLALVRAHVSGRDQRPEAFHSELLNIVQIDAANRVTARILFDLNDIDAAFEELDRRYLADEAAAHAHTWSVISQLYAGFNRHELPATTPEFAYVDHRPVITIDANDLPASIRAVWDLTPDISIYMEAVHRLNDLGAVVTHTARGVSHEDFDAEWRMIDIFTVDGDLISRCEMFDEPDLDAALARFEELQPQAQRLENAASHLTERFLTHFAAHEWNAMAEILADDVAADDRRRVVGAGPQHGRDAAIADMRAIGDLGRTNVSMTVIATRGERLALSRMRFSFPDQGPDAFLTDTLSIAEANSDHRVSAQISFEVDEIDAAFAELDARYFAGEAAAHAHTWSVIARTCAAFNRHELPAADWVIIDHRRLAPIGTSDLQAAIHAIWDLTPDLSTRIEAVHRLSSFGAVVTQTARGISREGFDAEWRMIDVYTVEGDLISRLEMFDETDLDAALARFDQLSLNAGPAPSGDS